MKILLVSLFLLFLSVNSQELDEEDIKNLNEEIFANLKAMNITDKTITKAQFILLFKRLFEKNNPKAEGVPPSAVEDQFMFDVMRAIVADVPDTLDVNEIYKYIDPHKLEKIVNDMLSGVDISKIVGEYEKEKQKAQDGMDKIKKEMEEKMNNKREEVVEDL